MRILHTSDWHIGRQFHNVSLLNDQHHVLQQIVEIANTEEVDVVVIAGDIYDRAVPPASAISLVDETLNQLIEETKIPVVLIAGNHDSPERLHFASRQLATAKLYVSGILTNPITPITLYDEHGKIDFYTIPYIDPPTVKTVYKIDVQSHDEAMKAVCQKIPANKNRRNILLSHCFVGGGETCESERPLSIGGTEQVSAKHFADFNYVALGHLHGRQYSSKEHIRYSGSILKYSFSEEKHNKSVTIVDMDAQGKCNIKHIALQPLHDMRSLEGMLDDLLETGKNDPGADDYLLIRLNDTHAILDPMGKLREVYPNVLHLERPGLMATTPQKLTHQEQLKKGELEMFRDFYQQVLNEKTSDEQNRVLETILDDIHHERGQ
jgi:exonuclease SbcD